MIEKQKAEEESLMDCLPPTFGMNTMADIDQIDLGDINLDEPEPANDVQKPTPFKPSYDDFLEMEKTNAWSKNPFLPL